MSKYFTDKDFSCHCGCGLTITDDNFIRLLDKAREQAGIPFVITSGARCLEHNEKVGGSITSSHINGLAVDIAFKDSHSCFLILKSLYDVGFRRLGINFNKSFIHVDVDEGKVQDVLFKY